MSFKEKFLTFVIMALVGGLIASNFFDNFSADPKYHKDRKPIEIVNSISNLKKDLNGVIEKELEEFGLEQEPKKQVISQITNFLDERLPNTYLSIQPQKDEALTEDEKERVESLKNSLAPNVEITALPPIELLGKKEEKLASSKNVLNKVRLTISASLNPSEPGNRFERIYAFLILPYGTGILNASALETEVKTVELGKVIKEMAGGGALTNPGVGKIEQGFVRKLERTLSREYSRRNLMINSDQNILMVSQDALEGTDLSGNINTNIWIQHHDPSLVDITVFSKPEALSNMGVKVNKTHLIFPNTKEVRGVVLWIAQVRGVIEGASTISESDDVVVPLVFSDVYPISLWKNNIELYTIVIQEGKEISGKKAARNSLVSKKRYFPGGRLVAFTDINDALKFREYIQKFLFDLIQKLPNKIPKSSLSLSQDLKVGFFENKCLLREVSFPFFEENGKLFDVGSKVVVYKIENSDFPLGYFYPAPECP